MPEVAEVDPSRQSIANCRQSETRRGSSETLDLQPWRAGLHRGPSGALLFGQDLDYRFGVSALLNVFFRNTNLLD
jgi:hypothetical protein